MSSRTRARRVAALVAAAVVAIPLPAQQVRVMQRDSLIRRDSMVMRLMPQDADALLREVMTLRERETKLAGELRALPPTEITARRRLIEELQATARDGFALMSVIEARCAAERMAPEGFLGLNLTSTVNADGAGRVTVRNAVVTSVEPGSPAQRAGIEPGDRVLAIAGRDFQSDLPAISDLLTVGRKLVVRTEREGNAREVTLTVARRPESFGKSCGEFERVLQPLRMAGPSRMAMEAGLPRRSPAVDSARAAGTARGTPDDVRIFVFSPGAGGMRSVGFYAGAEFRTLDDEWRAALGLKAGTTGVIVSEVAPGSPSSSAGLRKGDVITAVGKSPATSPEVLVRLLSVTQDQDATLAVTRGKERMTVTLRMAPR